MALRVESEVNLTISIDNAPKPSQIVFASGDNDLIDTDNYADAVGQCLTIPINTADLIIPMGNLQEADLIYMQVIPPQPIAVAPPTPPTPIVVVPFLVKLVPVGGDPTTTPWMTLAFNVPAIIPFKVQEIHVQNADTVSAVTLQIGIAGE